MCSFVCSNTLLNKSNMIKKKEKASKLFYNEFGVTVNLTRDSRKAKNYEDDSPLKWCVTFQGVRTYYKTGLSFNKADWELYLNDSKVIRIKTIANKTDTHFKEVLKPKVEDLAKNGTFTFDTLNNRLSKSVGNDVKEAFRVKIQNLMSSDKVGNASIYRCTLRSIEMYNSKTILFSDITPTWLDKYQSFLIAKPLRYATIGIYLRTLRAIINDAIADNTIDASLYPFRKGKEKGKHAIPVGAGRELALQLRDIKRMAEYLCPTKTIEMCRDLWIFSFYCNGANFGDILRFKNSDIKDGEIYFYRKKTKDTTITKIEIIAPILPIMQLTIDKWGNIPKKTNYIFPFLNNCKTETEFKKEISNIIRLTNKKIKVVTKELALPNVSTYAVRHSYSTILAKKKVPESYIDESLGHSDSKNVTRKYIGHYNKQERILYNSMLLWKPKIIWKTKRQIIWKRKLMLLEN